MKTTLFYCALLSLLVMNIEVSNAQDVPAPAPVSSSPALQQEPDIAAMSPDRPGFSTGTGIVPRGSIQLEAGLSTSRSGADRENSLGELLVRVPVTSRSEFRIGVPTYLADRSDGQKSHGFDDLFLETKILLAQNPRAAYALLLNSVVPTGSHQVAEHRFQPGANLAANLVLSDDVGLTLNLGAAHASDGGQHFNQLSGAACFNFTLSSQTGAFAELYSYNQRGGPTQKYVDGGFTYLLTPHLQLDASAGIGINNHAGGPDYFTGVGVARLF